MDGTGEDDDQAPLVPADTPRWERLMVKIIKAVMIYIIHKQGDIKCANLRTGFIDREGSHQYSEEPKHTLFCRESLIFVAKKCNYDIFVAKIYDYALIDSF